MAQWDLLDSLEHKEEYAPVVCTENLNSNFSIVVNAVFQHKEKCGDINNLSIKSFFRSPYICVYFDNISFILTDQGSIKFIKYFSSTIKNILIRKNSDVLVVVLNDGRLFNIDIITEKTCTSEDCITYENFSLDLLVEKNDESIILVNEKKFYPNLLLNISDVQYELNNLKFCIKQSQQLAEEEIHSIQSTQNKLFPVYESSIYIKPSINGNIDCYCPITNQNCTIGEELGVTALRPFKDSSHLLMLSAENDHHTLNITRLKDLQKIFTVKVIEKCFIIGGSNSLAFYANTQNDKLSFLMIKENSPVSQLEILIALRKYEEAEQFAKIHNLSPMAVLQLKAKCLLNNLKKEFCTESLSELEEIFTEFDNLEFIVNSCCESVEVNIELSHLLEFAKTKLSNTNNFMWNKRVDELLWKVEAFKLIELQDDNFDISWDRFVNQNAIGLCKKFIISDLLDYATIVWVKSYRTILNSVKARDIADLLCSISLDTKLNSLLKWLEYFIPSVSSVVPHSADLIITWAEDRICVLENSVHWPEVGIQFAEKFSKLMFNSGGLIPFVPHSSEKIYNLISCMMQIQVLKNDYNIIVSLKDFTSLSSNELARLILKKVFTEDLESLLKKFLNDFIVKNNLNHDNLIKDYIEELVAMSPSIDEMKLEILINCIYNTDEKYQCIVSVLKAATVPWSKRIKNIADDALSSKHHLTSAVRFEIIHADLKSILMKYKCPDVTSDDFQYLIWLIIKKRDPEMIADIKKIINVYCVLKEDAYLLCIMSFIENNEVQNALDLFGGIEEDFKDTCLVSLLIMFESQLSSSSINRQLECNYLDFLKSSCGEREQDLEMLHKIYILKNKHKIFISLKDYCVEKNRNHSLSAWCKEKFSKLNNTNNNLKSLLLQVIEVGKLLMISKADCMLIIINDCDDEFLSLLANTIFMEDHLYLERNVKSLDIIVKLFPMIEIVKLSTLERIIKFIVNIQMNESKYLSYCIDVCSWLTSIYFTHNAVREILNSWKITPFFNPHVITSVEPIWKEIIYRNSPTSYKTKSISMCLCKSEEKCLDGSVCLKNTLCKLQMQQNDLHFVRLLSYNLSYHMVKSEIPTWFTELVDNAVKYLLSKMLMSEKLDHLLISSLLFLYSFPSEWLTDTLNSGVQQTKKYNLSDHILKCVEMYNHIDVPYHQATLIQSQINISIKLESYGIVVKNSQDDSYNFSMLLDTLLNTKSCNIDILKEFCAVANLDINHSLTRFLFSLLKRWNDDYVFDYDCFGNCKITCKKEEFVTENCLKIIKKITPKEQLLEHLTTLFKNGEIILQNTTVSLGLYCYEAYIFILELIKLITGKQVFVREYLVLKFLQTYQRITKPEQSELDEFSMKENFPKIGYYRLPYKLVMCDKEFWNNLKPEITLCTYKRWLPVAGLLRLHADIQVSRDMICSKAVKQSMTSEQIRNEKLNMKWSMHLKNNRLLKEAHECVQYITNLEWAGACLYYVFQGSAFGADQVAALDMCYQFAEHWAKVEPNNNAVQKMRTKYLLTSSAHVLHKIGLAEDKLLSLCDNPHRLIEALYHHRFVLTRYECSNINSAVDEIAEKHSLNAGTLRMRILERILSLSSDNLTNVSDGTLNREMLMRACYILKGTNPMMAALYLSRIGLNNSDIVDNYNANIRALQCLLSLVDSDVIEKVTSNRVSELWEKLWKLYFINGLNIIGLEYLVAIFKEDKLQCVRQMWSTRNHTNLMLLLIIKMMIVYKFNVEDELLNEIIKIVLKFDLMYEIQNFLLSIRLLYSSNYVDMWRRVLITPFKRLESPLVGQQKEDCFETLKMLPLCPVINQIDLSPIWINCIKTGATNMAVLVLPHLSVADRKIVMKKMGKIKMSMYKDLKQMKSKGILTINMVGAILKREFPNA